MIVKQLYAEPLSQASYLIADEVSGNAVIVDPLRDAGQYAKAADVAGLTIVGVILTHFHADFLAGHLELSAMTGAWIGLGDRARAGFEARLLSDGERIELGDVVLEILATPGHTPESISVLVYEHADDEIAHSVLTGDSLFVGDVGRVDLQASFGADPIELAHEQYETIQHRFMSLPDEVRVLPAHGAGSACGKNISTERQSTIGHERATNPNCQPMPAADFVAIITAGQPPVPCYFVEDARMNRESHPLFDETGMPRSLDPEEARDLVRRGALTLDTREPDVFVAGHIVGSLNVPLAGRFAETAGMFLDYAGAPIVLVTDAGDERDAVRQLARIGFDNVAGFVASNALIEPALLESLVTIERLEPDDYEAERASARPSVLVDVRNPGEFETTSIPGADNIPLSQLPRHAAKILAIGGKVLVNCASGWRSAVGSSYLRSVGVDAVDLRGGINAWSRTRDEAVLPLIGAGLEVPVIGGGVRRYINLDYAASTPALEVVARHVTEVLPYYASVHRGAGYASQVSTAAYENARNVVGDFVGAGDDDIVVFTRNTTDSLNLLASVVPGDVVVLDIEHHADLLPWLNRGGRVVKAAPTIRETLQRLERELASKPAALLALVGASNVTGETMPLRTFSELAHRYGARLSVDGAQLVPHRRVDMTADGIDYLSFSGHKIYAPFGAGALVGRRDWLDEGDPYLLGGGAVERVRLESTTWRTGPARHEAGSPNVIGTVALAEAVRAISRLNPSDWYAHEATLRDRLVAGLGVIPGVETLRIFSDSEQPVGVVSFTVGGADVGLIAAALAAEHGIGVRDGRFCAHPLLEHLGVEGPALRVSFGVGSRSADIDTFLQALAGLVSDGPAFDYEIVDGQWIPVDDARPRPEWSPELDPAMVQYGCAV
jgi:selenocysteine lyase/cysteine desulfurase/glyoxylase-like metal-dependent hydrolase (beta-lactamase superfamily II)/rhodanese-related sulfurtransferase